MKNDRYPIKVAAVRRLDSGESSNKVCKELHICRKSLILWYAQYQAGGELSLLRESNGNRRSVEERQLIIKDIIDNKLSLTSASEKYLIPRCTL